LDIPDITNFLFLVLISVLTLLFVDIHLKKYLIVFVNIAFIFVINLIIKKYEIDKSKSKTIKLLRFWYPVIMILVCFKEIYLIMMYSTGGVLYDDILIQLDRTILSTDPTVFLSHFANPVLTEVMQIIYSAFYLMPVIIGVQLYTEKRYNAFKYAMFVVFLGFYISFIGYLVVPAIGPRFTLHDFLALNTEMPGLFLTQLLRDIINIGESIPPGVTNPTEYAQRDAFPSGHTIMIIIITYLAYKFESRKFYLYLIYCILMIISTVYLRYHYVIDLIAAVPVSVFTIYVANYLYRKKLQSVEVTG